MVFRTLWVRAALLAAMLPAPIAAQQQLPAQLRQGPPSDVPVALQILRWDMLNGNVSPLTFQSMDRLFTTRTVARSGPVWTLPRGDRTPDFRYRFAGQDHSFDDMLERTYTNALLIMKDGRIVTEIYRNGTDERTRFMGFSLTKSVTSTLIGCALADGLIRSLDDDITRYLPELKGGGYNGVTIRQILQMRSGVDYEERYDFANPGIAARNHIDALVKNVSRFADPARTIARAHKPGEVFAYKTIDTAVLGWLIERVSKGSVAAYTARKLWEPLGAESDAYYIMDGAPGTGREFSGAGFNATLRDWGRFGAMLLDGGTADGRRIVSADWVRDASRPTGKEDTPFGGYGYQFWTRAGSDAFSGIGIQGQFVFVDPTTRTVVVKLSYFPPDATTTWEETAAFLDAASAWKPR